MLDCVCVWLAEALDIHFANYRAHLSMLIFLEDDEHCYIRTLALCPENFHSHVVLLLASFA